MLPIIALVFAVAVGLAIFLLLQWDWCRQVTSTKLPPGSMGWPYIGETLKLYTQHPNTFFSIRKKRYGNIFKSHILGCPCVMIASPEAARVVLVSQAHLFKPTYPPSKEKMIGPQALFFHQGSYHWRLKKLVHASFLPSAIRPIVPAIENIVLNFLPTWENTRPVYTLKEMKQYAFEVAMLSAFGDSPEPETRGIKRLYQILEKGYNSMPLDFPGTPFYRAMKAREALGERLRRLIEKRRGSGGGGGGGLLGILLAAQNQNQQKLTDSQIADNVIGVIFAAHDTTATVLTWLLKYLHDHPNVLDAVIMEQGSIHSRLLAEDRQGLRWEDTRRMPFTTRVVQETLRSASILSFTFREAVEDVEFQGFVIPKGWKVLPLFRSIHHCSDFFPHPENFDPARFEVSPKPYTYMPFGNGIHSCPGSELAVLEILILLHHLTLTYRWEVIGEDDTVQYCPFPVPKGGLPIRLSRLHDSHGSKS